MIQDPQPENYSDWVRHKLNAAAETMSLKFAEASLQLWRSVEDAFANWGTWLPAAYIILCLSFISLTNRIGSDQNQLYYLLSTQAQVLGTLLGILFTTTMVAVELIRQYSQQQLESVLGLWIVWYIFLYIGGVSLPIFYLYTGATYIGSTICFVLGGLCIFTIFPFSITLTRRLDASYHIDKIQSRADKKLDDVDGYINLSEPNAFDEVIDNIEYISEIAMGSIKRSSFPTYRYSVSSVEDIMKRMCAVFSETRFKGNDTEYVREMGFRISNMARGIIDHPNAPFLITDVLKSSGKESIDQGVISIARTCIYSLRKIGQHAVVERPIGDLSINTTRSIAEIGEAAAKQHNERLSSLAVQSITDISIGPKVKGLTRKRELLSLTVRQVGKIGNITLSLDQKNKLTEDRLGIINKVHKHISWVIKYDYKEVSIAVVRAYESVFRPTLIKRSDVDMDAIPFDDIAEDSLDAIRKVSENIRENGSAEEKVEASRTLTYAIQHGIDAGMVEKSEEAFDVLDGILRGMLEAAHKDHPVWDISGSLGYAVNKCISTNSDLGSKAHDLLIHITNKACESDVDGENLKTLMDAHENIVKSASE